jgi:hypothetical protein
MFGNSVVNSSDVDVNITSFFVKYTFFQSFWGFSPSIQQEGTVQSYGLSCTKETPNTSKIAKGISCTMEASGASLSDAATCQPETQDITALGKQKRDLAAGTYVIHLFFWNRGTGCPCNNQGQGTY